MPCSSFEAFFRCLNVKAIGKINRHSFPIICICFIMAGPNIHPGNWHVSLCLRSRFELGGVTLLPMVTSTTLTIRADLRSEQSLLGIPGKVITEVSYSHHGSKVHPGVRGWIIKSCKHSEEAGPTQQWQNEVKVMITQSEHVFSDISVPLPHFIIMFLKVIKSPKIINKSDRIRKILTQLQSYIKCRVQNRLIYLFF